LRKRREAESVSHKEVIIEAVRQMPDEASMEEIVERLAILAAIRRGEAAADAGDVISHEEVKKRLASWITK
jgi:predicted transcriptional regulator